MNQQTWGDLEEYCRTLINQGKEMYIIAGGYGNGGTGSLGGTTTSIASGNIKVPSAYWKIIMVLSVDSSDLSRVSTSTRVIAVLMPNTQTVNAHSWDYYRVSVDSIEALTGYDFFSNVDTSIQRVIEAQVDNGATNLLAWDFTGANNVATWAATSVHSYLDTTIASTNITRGPSSPSSSGANSFRSAGFQNNGISTANTDYYQIKIKADTGYLLSLATIDARYTGTSSFAASPGVTAQYAYSLDGTTFTLIGSPFVTIGTSVVMPTINLSGISALQNLPNTQPVWFRYYASGQTTTGGWGYYSYDTGINGLSFGGSLNHVAPITGSNYLCASSSTTLANASPGGYWVSSNPGIATIGSTTGSVSGIAPGTAVISYLLSGITTFTVTVLPLPTVGSISGPASVAPGATITLTNSSTGGTWLSTNTAIATIGSISGIVSGISSGTSLITYRVTNTCGAVVSTKIITVNNSLGAITGANHVCVGQSTALSDTGSGRWTSSNPTLARIDSLTGMVTGLVPGALTITYSLSGSNTTMAFTVNPSPANISGTTSICMGSTATLGNSTTGGLWSSSNASIIAIGSTTGIISGISAGSAIITYQLATGCFNTTTVSAGFAGPIIGPSSVCVGQNITLSNSVSGGTWSSSAPTILSIGSSSGVATGIAGGLFTNVTYTIGSGCQSIATITVNALSAISGPNSVCTGQTITLANATAGGTWLSSTPGIATVGASTGIVTGITGGTLTISYIMPSGCSSTFAITVNAISAISGPSIACVGQTITLTNSSPGGTWSSGSPTIATIGSASGIVIGIAGGLSANITYSLGSTCRTFTTITVNALSPITIPGTTPLCQGSTVLASDASAGGTWSSSNTGIATINGTGTITGVSAGTAIISYRLGSGCTAILTATVNPIAPITGSSSVCQYNTTTLTDATPGGTWYSGGSSATIASIGSATGIVTGLAANLYANLTYSLPSGCKAYKTMSVFANPIVGTITGPPTVSISGLPITLADATTGGIWSSANATRATVGSLTGVVTGVSTGTLIISYTVTNGAGCSTSATKNIIVGATPHSDDESLFIITNEKTPNNFSIQPNPNQGDFILNGTLSNSPKEPITILITDINGRQVYKSQISTTTEKIHERIILAEPLPNGLYLIHLFSGLEDVHLKFVIGK